MVFEDVGCMFNYTNWTYGFAFPCQEKIHVKKDDIFFLFCLLLTYLCNSNQHFERIYPMKNHQLSDTEIWCSRFHPNRSILNKDYWQSLQCQSRTLKWPKIHFSILRDWRRILTSRVSPMDVIRIDS